MVAVGGGEAALGRPGDVGLGLLTIGAEGLAEVAAAVGEGDGDEGGAEVGGGAEGIAGEDAEASGVGGEVGVEGDLHREVGDGAGGDVEVGGGGRGGGSGAEVGHGQTVLWRERGANRTGRKGGSVPVACVWGRGPDRASPWCFLPIRGYAVGNGWGRDGMGKGDGGTTDGVWTVKGCGEQARVARLHPAWNAGQDHQHPERVSGEPFGPVFKLFYVPCLTRRSAGGS